MKKLSSSLIGLAILVTAGCANTLPRDVEATLFYPDHPGFRWGLIVADMSGEALIALKLDDRFTPASNTTVFTPLAAHHKLKALEQPPRTSL